MLKDLYSKGYEIRLTKDPNPKSKNVEDERINLTDQTNAKELLDKIDSLLPKKKYRPHLSISRSLLDNSKDKAIELTEQVKSDMDELASYLRRCAEGT